MTPPSKPPLAAGVIGTGALGRHHTRLLSGLPGVELVGIHDRSRETAERVGEEFGVEVFDDAATLAERLDAAVVAVPTVDHAALAVPLLERGLHVLVEKPLAPSLAEADRILEAASAAGRVLAVGHVEFYNPAVQALLDAGLTARYVEVHRLSPFTPRSLDVDVILDLMIHDLQILHALDPSPVTEIRATGIDVLSPRIDIANVRIALASGCVANLTASRVSSEKVRKLRVFSASRYTSVDYPEQEVKGYRLVEGGGRREIVEDAPSVEKAEPLKRELEAFVAECRGEGTALVDGAAGRRALATALAIVEAIAEPG